MDRERVLSNHTVIVENGVIRAIGPREQVQVPADAQVIDGTGMFLLPGLADLHVHLQKRGDLIQYVASGVTTVLDLGSDGHGEFLPRRESDSRRSRRCLRERAPR